MGAPIDSGRHATDVGEPRETEEALGNADIPGRKKGIVPYRCTT